MQYNDSDARRVRQSYTLTGVGAREPPNHITFHQFPGGFVSVQIYHLKCKFKNQAGCGC